MPAKTQGRVALGVTVGRAPWGAQRKGYRQRHRWKECCRGSQITEGKVPGHRERDACIRGTEGRGAMGGTQRRGAIRGRAPPAGSVPHPSSAPVKATLFSGSRKMRNTIIKAIQKKGGPKRKSGKICSTSARVGPPQVGLTLAHAQLQTSVPIFYPHLRGRGAAAMVTPSANIFSSFLAPEAV